MPEIHAPRQQIPTHAVLVCIYADIVVVVVFVDFINVVVEWWSC